MKNFVDLYIQEKKTTYKTLSQALSHIINNDITSSTLVWEDGESLFIYNYNSKTRKLIRQVNGIPDEAFMYSLSDFDEKYS